MDKLSEIMKRKGESPSKEFCTNEYQLNQESRTGYKADGSPGTNFTPQYWSKIKFFPFGEGDWLKGVKQNPFHSIGYSKKFKIKWYLKLTTNPPYLGMSWNPDYRSEEYILYKIEGSEIIEQEPISFIIENFTDAEKQEWYACVDSVRNEFMSKNLYIINENGNFEKNENSWKDGKRNGKWTYWYNNGNKKKEIVYDSGNIINEWSFYYGFHANGEKETQGKYRKDINGNIIYDGKWIEWYENGQKNLEKNYKDGKQDGLENFWYENGQKKYEVNYKNEKLDGLYTSWYPSGKKNTKLIYNDGKLNGPYTLFHENDETKEEGTYKDGELDGKSISWYENGQKKSESNWEKGLLAGKMIQYLDTGQKEEVIFKNGKEDGKSTLWWDWEGQKKNRIGFFENGEKTGTWTYWSFDGKETWEITYKDGKKWEGKNVVHYLNHQKMYEGTYRNGRKDGLWILWYEDGNKWREKTFNEGNIVQEECFDENGSDVDCDLIEDVVF